MKTKLKITIGIPAYNEGANILSLLEDLLTQNQQGWIVQKILVYSDGSTDDTIQKVRSLHNSNIELIVSKERLGVSLAQNKIFKKSNGDVLLLLNADIRIYDTSFINSIIQPFYSSTRIGLVGVRVIPVQATTFFERIINFSHMAKMKLYTAMGTDNVYLNHGRARAFSKEFYSRLRYPEVIADDAYSYFKCKSLGFSFSYADHSTIFFRSPRTMEDHLRQSERFKIGRKQLDKYFPKKMINEQYSISLYNILTICIDTFFKNPIYSVAYLYIISYSYVVSALESIPTSTAWEPSKTSKSI